VVLFNRSNPSGVRFWEPLIELLGGMVQPGAFVVAGTLEEILPAIRRAWRPRVPAEA